jgi:glycosidase
MTFLRPRVAWAALGTLLVAVLATAAPALSTKVTFRYQPVIGGVNTVSVAGSFNAWNATDHPLADPAKSGIWSAEFDLPPGRVTYKFVVNGDQWMTDETAADFEADGFGGQNSVLVVGDQPVVAGYGTTVKKAAAPKMGLRRVPFAFKPEKPTSEPISLAGTFNDWTVGKTVLTGPGADGSYSVTLLIAPGSYQYKFVVGAGGWTQDKAGQDGESDDGYGGKNSIRNVDDRFPAIAVKRGDGDVFADGLAHTQAANEVNVMGGGHVQFTARAHLDDVEGIDLVTWPAGKETVTRMGPVNQDKIYEYFRTEITMPAGATAYAFRYRDGAKSQWLGPKGLTAAVADKFTFDATKFTPFVTPDWVRNGIIYQIFPDRFRNGNPGNDPDFHEWYYEGKRALPASGTLNLDYQEYYHLVKNWDDYSVLTQAPHTPDHRDWMAFYGGDIAGVREKLDYLKSLGVTILYFNPIFEAKSTHKYDAADYRKIDPHFGTNEEFIAFVKEAHAKGIRIILDIVYNHCGNSNWAFRDAVEKGDKSPYWGWFEFKKWPLPQGWPAVDHAWKPSDYYTCWWNFGDLPDLNFDLSRDDKAEIPIRDVKDAQPNIPLVQYLLDATTYWLKDAGVDGLRLDVPNEVPYWFWKLFNQRVKSTKPDAYIVGELWGNASDYVRPGVYDAVMNYAFFRDPVLKFLGQGQGSATEFDASLATGRLTYPSQAVEVQMNLIDSHDTVRFLTQVGGNVNRLMLASLFQMTYVGAPTIYYGDEIAMEGQRDPDCRRPFVWGWEKDAKRVAMHEWYAKLAGLRNAHPALRTGEFRTVSATGMTYAYTRRGAGEEYLVALNAGKSPASIAVDLAPWGGKLVAVNALGAGSETWSGTATLSLPAESGRIWKITR